MRAPLSPTITAAGPGPDARVVPLEGRRRKSRAGRSAARAEPVRDGGISMTVCTGVPVVSCVGLLGVDAVRPASLVFAAAVKLRPRSIVVDLSRACLDEDSVPVLGLMRHFATRHGVGLALAAVPPRGMDVLRRAEVAGLYEVHATPALALAAAVDRSRRSLPRRAGLP